ncbi:MAG: AMP-dependent synthetase and ligase, partial [Actinomycetia bacterium]|nr:AMP-dependent synthetase and ligase [Actinomycetes bacterium]
MLAATIREAARRFGDRTAYVTEAGWSLSYANLDQISDEIAAGLARRGIGPGDVSALVLPPGPEYLLLYLANAKLGAVTAGVNDRLSERERIAVLEVAQPALTIATPGSAPARGESIEVSPAASLSDVCADLRIAGAALAPRDELPDDPVAIIFTSGTTGLPKGACYCNRQLAFITETDVGDNWDTGGRSFTGTSFAHLGFMTKLPGNLR